MSLRRATRPLRHGLAFVGLRGLVGLLRLLPLGLSVSLGAAAGRAIGALARGETARMRARLALLDDPPTPGACWADLGRRFVEWTNARRMLDRVRVHGAELAEEPRPRGALVATAHLGNWELMAAALAARGLPVEALAARDRGGPLHAWLARERATLGVRTHSVGGGARAARRILGDGGALALFIDQATHERCRPVPFLGRPAPTPTTLERLRDLSGARVVFAYTLRAADGRHDVFLEAPAEPTLEALTARVEALVRDHPAQWVWLHDRFPA